MILVDPLIAAAAVFVFGAIGWWLRGLSDAERVARIEARANQSANAQARALHTLGRFYDQERDR